MSAFVTRGGRAIALGCIFLSCLLPVCSSVASVVEDRHLVPEYSIFSDKYEKSDALEPDDGYGRLLNLFSELYEPRIFARVIILPFEEAIALERNDDFFRVKHLKTKTRVSRFSRLKDLKSGRLKATGADGKSKIEAEIRDLEAVLPESYMDVGVSRCTREIDPDLGKRLYILWADMLFRTRYPDQRPINPEDRSFHTGRGGVTYHFAFDDTYPRMAGSVWSPDRQSVTGKFVHITRLLRRFCLEDDPAIIGELVESIDDLSGELAKTPY